MDHRKDAGQILAGLSEQELMDLLALGTKPIMIELYRRGITQAVVWAEDGDGEMLTIELTSTPEGRSLPQ